ncbi:type VI secretion system baseplate subunit TssF [Anaeromyxobacter oryzisoli]|uniref:type VI secretion system baseplate subunit TssF n=1 Tax=Anaeromyxobacter oryzisoli TaxID=2925408 RepID=UPI001F5A77A5|nr:type VI secretion system baseplate subunit TssF [Anaeromyxobacter sp. SG63]
MFSRHYQGELAFLRAMGKEFAAAHPTIAGLLAERGGDPDVERLLEGVAFLTARTRERLEAGVPEIVHDLAEMLAPQYLRPIPATTVVEFTPVPGVLRARAQLAAGAEVASVAVGGVSCRFRTTAELALLPVTVQDVALDQAIGAAPAIRIQLHAAAAALRSVLQDDAIRFFLHGELPLATTLLLWLGRHLAGVEVRAGGSGRAIQLDRRAVRLAGGAIPLLPWPSLAPAGYRTLLEYFTFPQKFLFFDVTGLSAARDLGEERLELVLRFERPPELPARIGKDTFRLNCTPVVNLFSIAGEPVRVEALGEEHLIRAAGMEPRHVEVHSVDAVEGVADARGVRRPYAPFSSFGHGAEGREARFYRLRRRGSILDDGIDTFVSLGTPRDGGPGGEETLSLELTCTNRSLPAQLKVGDLSVATQSSPTTARFRNITPVTKPIRPPLGAELQWRLVAHLAANRASLARADCLRALLELYNFPALLDQHAGSANRLRIEGIRGVEAGPARRALGGAVVRGTKVALELDEASFGGPGDAFLFGEVLDELFASQVGLNGFTELATRLHPSQREYAWTPRNGTRPLV